MHIYSRIFTTVGVKKKHCYLRHRWRHGAGEWVLHVCLEPEGPRYDWRNLSVGADESSRRRTDVNRPRAVPSACIHTPPRLASNLIATLFEEQTRQLEFRGSKENKLCLRWRHAASHGIHAPQKTIGLQHDSSKCTGCDVMTSSASSHKALNGSVLAANRVRWQLQERFENPGKNLQ